VTQNERLVNRIKELVGSANYDEVSNIIDCLIQIEKFKHQLSDTQERETKFELIAKHLKKEYNIQNLKISHTIKGDEEIDYFIKDDSNQEFSYSFNISLIKKATIQADLYNEHLNDIDKIKLDSFLDEILTTLYLTFIIDTLQESSFLDPLTGLKNRMGFDEEMKDIIPLALREQMNIGVLVLNIDRFRAVNDEHGALFGDKFLKNYAHTLQDSIRTSDIAIRYGGGEFLVLLLNVSSEDKTLEIAKEIQTKLNESYILSPYSDPFYKTTSIGISMFPADSSDIFEVVQNANNAVTDAKDQGRSQILRFIIEDEGDLDLF
jgi:diguanylate cyclase (GGDEF)-like protein